MDLSEGYLSVLGSTSVFKRFRTELLAAVMNLASDPRRPIFPSLRFDRVIKSLFLTRAALANMTRSDRSFYQACKYEIARRYKVHSLFQSAKEHVVYG